MLYKRLLPYGCLFAIAANAQDTTSASSSSSSSSSSTSSSGSSSDTSVTGVSELETPTGNYITYSSTITVSSTTSSALTTSPIVSTETSDHSTITTTLGSTTIFGINSIIIASNTTNTTTTSTSTPSQTFLSASHSSTSVNGTSNSTATSTSTSVQPTNTTPCNNYAEFCGRKYGNITEVSAHNSPFVRANNAAANQLYPVTTQLNDGIRNLQGQMHFNGSVPHFCHTSCDVLDVGPITEYLGTVYDWVSTHPYDVVTIILENGDYKPVTDYVSFIESTGLVQYAYIPPVIPMAKDDWPTLASMLLTGKRVIFFMDYDANQTAVPWILDEFSQVWETPFDPTNNSFPCDVQRPPNLSDADAKNRLYLTNHNLNYDITLLGDSLLVPNIPALNVTNNVTGFGSLGVGAQTCVNDWDYPPKFLNVDYYEVGSGTVFEVAAKWNNVTYDRPCCGTATTSDGQRTLDFVGRSAIAMAVIVVVFSWMVL